MDNVFTVILQVFFTTTLVALMLTYLHNGTVRPFFGRLFFKKPLLRRTMDPLDLFRIGNFKNGKQVRVETLADLYKANSVLMEAIKQRSWFVRQDRATLNFLFDRAYNQVYVMEERKREETRKAEERFRKTWNNYHKKNNKYDDDFEDFYSSYTRGRGSSSKKKPEPIKGWRQILGVADNERDPAVIKKRYRVLVSKDHPDKGGSGKQMPAYNRALDAARNELNFV